MGLKEFEILLKELKVTYGKAINYEIRNLSNTIVIKIRNRKNQLVVLTAPMVSRRLDGVRDLIPHVSTGRKTVELDHFHKYVEAIVER